MPRKQRETSRAQQYAVLKTAAAAIRLPAHADVCVLGGGAAGLVAAIVAAEQGAQVVVLERTLECGRTILATGNGRCNFANAHLDAACYNDPTFVRAVCGDAWLPDVLSFFQSCGLAWAEEGEGRLYPLSRQAASVRNVLLFRAQQAGVVLAPAREVVEVERTSYGFICHYIEAFGKLEERGIASSALVVATGGSSPLCQRLGLPTTEPTPLLCPLACPHPLLKSLDGIRVRANAQLVRGTHVLTIEEGEVLFRDYGLSGIAIFNLSRHAKQGDKIVLDLIPSLSQDEARKRATSTLDGILDPVLTQALLCATHGSLTKAINTAKSFSLTVKGLAQQSHAQVHRGGLATSSFNPASLACTIIPGLFACGEALNVDGPCGGYNLAWAWKSGMVAGAGAATAIRAAKEATHD